MKSLLQRSAVCPDDLTGPYSAFPIPAHATGHPDLIACADRIPVPTAACHAVQIRVLDVPEFLAVLGPDADIVVDVWISPEHFFDYALDGADLVHIVVRRERMVCRRGDG